MCLTSCLTERSLKMGSVKWLFLMRTIFLGLLLLATSSVAIAQDLTPEQLYIQLIRSYYPDNSYVQSSTDEALLVAGQQHCTEMAEIGVREHSARVVDWVAVYEERVGGQDLRNTLYPTLATAQATLCYELVEAEGYRR